MLRIAPVEMTMVEWAPPERGGVKYNDVLLIGLCIRELRQQPGVAVLLSGQVPFGVFIAAKTIVCRVETQRPSRAPVQV
jgi:hypothetical protein